MPAFALLWLPSALSTMTSYVTWLLRIPVLFFLAGFATSQSGTLSSRDGVYDSSITPANLPWNTYNYCNAPHVNARHYSRPANASHAKLVYMNAVIRHHKVRWRQVGGDGLEAVRG